jgi:hypothetical protein
MTYVVAFLLALSGALIFTVEIPAQIDYVNHLARMHLLFDAAHARPNPFYAVESKLILNQACDLIVPPIARLTGVNIAMKLFLFASQVLIVSGAMAVEATIKGRTQFAGVVAILMLYAVPIAWGLVNFTFGVGIALWAITMWLRLQTSPWSLRIAIHACFVLTLFVSHVFTLGLYGLVIGLLELTGQRRITEFALMAIPPGIALAAFLLLPHAVGDTINWQWDIKLLWPVIMMTPLGIGPSALIATSLVALFTLLLHRRAIAVPRQGALVVAGMIFSYLVFPRTLFESAFADIRILMMLLLILPAFAIFKAASKQLSVFSGACITTIALFSLLFSSVVWWQRQQDFWEMRESFKALGFGSRALIAADGPPEGDVTPIYYAPTLAAHYAGAFLPTLYTIKGAQSLVKTLPGYDIPNGLDYLPQPLSKILANEGPPYTRDWRNRYEYVFVFHDKGTLGLHAAYRGRHFTLYKAN